MTFKVDLYDLPDITYGNRVLFHIPTWKLKKVFMCDILNLHSCGGWGRSRCSLSIAILVPISFEYLYGFIIFHFAKYGSICRIGM